MVIGLCYYAICFVVLSRLLGRPSSWHEELAVGSLVLLLSGNALWSFLSFRRKNLEGSVLLSVAYIPVAVGLAVLLFNVDPPAGWVFLPYVLYLPYASWWTVRTWRLNRARV